MPRKAKVLIADDDQALLTALTTRLAKLNLDVITATDGYTSLAKAVSEQPDLLILDVNMPAGDGFSVQERLKGAGLARVPVIYLTGDRSERLDSIADKLGAVAIHRKPFELYDLVADIREALLPHAA